jgi:iron-sulfur cluster insertion protein
MDDRVEITNSAVEQIKEIVKEEGPDFAGALRIFVQGGGCSGFQYGFTFDEELNEDDWQFSKDGIKIVVDSMSMQYLEGSTIDYKKALSGSNFVISNPNAKTTCGCGSSFAA